MSQNKRDIQSNNQGLNDKACTLDKFLGKPAVDFHMGHVLHVGWNAGYTSLKFHWAHGFVAPRRKTLVDFSQELECSLAVSNWEALIPHTLSFGSLVPRLSPRPDKR